MKKMKLNIQKFGQNTTFSESNIDVSRNTSSLTINISFWAPTSQTWFASATLNCWCDGQQQSANVSLSRGGSVNASFTFHNIAHNNDGTKSVNWAWSCATGTSGLGTISNSGTQTLTQIPRQANITSCYDFNDEENPTMTFSNPGGFALNARLEFAGTNIKRDNIPNTGSITFTLTDAERKLLRQKCTGNSMTVRFVIATILNGNETWWSWFDKTMSIINATPIFNNFTFADTNTKTVALTGNNQHCIQGYSNIKGIISVANKAIAQKEATMSKYRFAIGTQSVDINYSSTAEVSGTINNSPFGVFNMFATDSRNNSKVVMKLATKVIQYVKPVINASTITATRDSGGVGTNCTLKFDGTFWNNNFGKKANSIKIKYQLKKTTESTWVDGTTTITPTINGNNFSFQGLIARSKDDPSWEISESYNIKVIVTDELDTSFTETILINAVPNLALSQNGVAIMSKYNETLGGDLQVGGRRIDKPIIHNKDANGWIKIEFIDHVEYIYTTVVNKTFNSGWGYTDDVPFPVGISSLGDRILTSSVICSDAAIKLNAGQYHNGKQGIGVNYANHYQSALTKECIYDFRILEYK